MTLRNCVRHVKRKHHFNLDMLELLELCQKYSVQDQFADFVAGIIFSVEHYAHTGIVVYSSPEIFKFVPQYQIRKIPQITVQFEIQGEIVLLRCLYWSGKSPSD